MNKTSQQIQLNILDVGQGQAIFLQHPEQTG
jgi:competence protein ComEC